MDSNDTYNPPEESAHKDMKSMDQDEPLGLPKRGDKARGNKSMDQNGVQQYLYPNRGERAQGHEVHGSGRTPKVARKRRKSTRQ